jgi:uncharacterized membrane protein YcgQ (UPF0703/DUF1980 family)
VKSRFASMCSSLYITTVHKNYRHYVNFLNHTLYHCRTISNLGFVIHPLNEQASELLLRVGLGDT